MAAPAPPTALAGALARVGDRWSLLVVDALQDGARRFADLHAVVPGIATNVLTQRLRQLEADRIVLAVPYSNRPVRYAYQLTEAGRALSGVVRLLAQWNVDHGGGSDGSEPATPVHPACGTALVARWWCPTCDEPSEGPPAEVDWI